MVKVKSSENQINTLIKTNTYFSINIRDEFSLTNINKTELGFEINDACRSDLKWLLEYVLKIKAQEK